MIIREEIARVQIRACDKVVSAVTWRDLLVIVTEHGKIFTLRREQHDE